MYFHDKVYYSDNADNIRNTYTSKLQNLSKTSIQPWSITNTCNLCSEFNLP